ncbi:DUF3109 family protein [Halocola ammonii]
MIQIDNTLISEEVFEKKFLCDITACKGACCVEGDSGAPLEEDELQKLEDVYEDVKPFMREEGIKAIEKEGFFTVDQDGDYVTPLVEGKECAYVNFDKNGIALCALEQAYRNKKTNWAKPLSCHLYPIRVTKLKDFDALNYHHWPICDPARECGAKIDLRVFKFAKDALVRKYGEDYYAKVEAAFELWKAKEE